LAFFGSLWGGASNEVGYRHGEPTDMPKRKGVIQRKPRRVARGHADRGGHRRSSVQPFDREDGVKKVSRAVF